MFLLSKGSAEMTRAVESPTYRRGIIAGTVLAGMYVFSQLVVIPLITHRSPWDGIWFVAFVTVALFLAGHLIQTKLAGILRRGR